MVGWVGGNSRLRWYYFVFILFFFVVILFVFDGGLEGEGGWLSSILLFVMVEFFLYVDVLVVVVGMVLSVGE